jgi:hypothetical protein
MDARKMVSLKAEDTSHKLIDASASVSNISFLPFSLLFVCSFVRSFVRSFSRSFVRSFARLFARPVVCSCIHSISCCVHQFFQDFKDESFDYIVDKCGALGAILAQENKTEAIEIATAIVSLIFGSTGA